MYLTFLCLLSTTFSWRDIYSFGFWVCYNCRCQILQYAKVLQKSCPFFESFLDKSLQTFLIIIWCRRFVSNKINNFKCTANWFTLNSVCFKKSWNSKSVIRSTYTRLPICWSTVLRGLYVVSWLLLVVFIVWLMINVNLAIVIYKCFLWAKYINKSRAFSINPWDLTTPYIKSSEKGTFIQIGKQTSTTLIITFIFCIWLVFPFACLPIRTNALMTIHSLPQIITKMEQTQLSNEDQVQWITKSNDMIKSARYKSSKSYLSSKSLYRRARKTYAEKKNYRLTQTQVSLNKHTLSIIQCSCIMVQTCTRSDMWNVGLLTIRQVILKSQQLCFQKKYHQNNAREIT